ncbi:hypothetical protein [Marinobacterium aestuariivivens]|uniref:DUF3149 domain-containing protein n=1 Tax=Marinobacterium aestuariivivens TaxID=1698799 RepID=A0ABW2A8G7_9GAMM
MFGIDAYSAEVLIPSVVGVVAMAGVMVWAFIKVRHLMNEDKRH